LFEERQPARIVGIVPNGAFSGVTRSGAFGGLGKDTRPNFVFLAEQQSFSAAGEKTFHIRYAGAPGRLIAEIRAAIRDVDGRVPVVFVRGMEEEFQEFIAPIRIPAILIGLFAASALLVASVGFICRHRVPYRRSNPRVWDPHRPRSNSVAGFASRIAARIGSDSGWYSGRGHNRAIRRRERPRPFGRRGSSRQSDIRGGDRVVGCGLIGRLLPPRASRIAD
jgi:hypothetical protein